jgi:uncharacterized membrane protein
MTVPHYSVIVTTLLLTLSACTDPNRVAKQREALGKQVDPNAQTFVFECGDDFNFTARTENERAWLFLRRDTIQLPQVPAASGVKFEEGGNMFWIKGNEAMLTTANRTHEDCKNNHRKAVWEHAKLNGVDFRAVGNEPGWVLEISNQANILFITNYGQSRHAFAGAGVSSATQGLTTIYEARNDQDRIEIKLTATRCGDTMSDEKFPVTVKVLLNQNEFNGCGRALH